MRECDLGKTRPSVAKPYGIYISVGIWENDIIYSRIW